MGIASPVSGPSVFSYEHSLTLGSTKTNILGFGEGRIISGKMGGGGPSSESLDTHNPSLPSHILFKFQVPAVPRPGQPRQVVAFPSAAEKRRGKSEPGWGWRGKNVDLDSKVL